MLDVVVFVEGVDQLEEGDGVVFGDVDAGLRAPRELGAFIFTEHGLERLGDFVQGTDLGPDFVAVIG